MSVQLVLCVADSVWRAAWHLFRVCMPAVHSQVYARLKAPMLTLMTGSVFEIGLACLRTWLSASCTT